jgi:hypothetical protein
MSKLGQILKTTKSFVLISVQLAGDGTKQKSGGWGAPGFGWGDFE